jgi:hypothetical protein
MSKAVSDIPFDKIYVGMKLNDISYSKGNVIFIKDNIEKNIVIEWERGVVSLHKYSDDVLKYYTFAE